LGYNDDGQATVPTGLTDAIAIAADSDPGLALHCDGRITAWGRNDAGQTTVPASITNAIAVEAGWRHSLAIVPAVALPPGVKSE
jgi:hypothetical protein